MLLEVVSAAEIATGSAAMVQMQYSPANVRSGRIMLEVAARDLTVCAAIHSGSPICRNERSNTARTTGKTTVCGWQTSFGAPSSVRTIHVTFSFSNLLDEVHVSRVM